jgi:hypothetical protein
MPPSPPQRFHGIIPPIATPLAGPDQLDIPAFYSSLYHAAAAGDLPTVLALLGICSDLMAEPLHAFSNPERAELRPRMLLCGLTPALT